MVTVVVGANWGDEGKGKITDALSKDFQVIARFQGGNNAGHTIINEYGKFALHMLPSGVFYQDKISVIGSGVALNIPSLVEEIGNLRKRSVPVPRILVSDRAQVVMPYHKIFDELEEHRLKKNAFGSTKSGIAPCFSDKYLKIGFQVYELFLEEEYILDKLDRVLSQKNVLLKYLYKAEEIRKEEIFETLCDYRDFIKPYVCNIKEYVDGEIKKGSKILLEGQLGALKDPDLGIYPMVTSSSTLASFSSIGMSIPLKKIERVIAVVKAYSSTVGAGPFVSEMFGDEAEFLRKIGGDSGEYGATTGRPRRVGFFDVVATKYGCEIQNATEIALTVIDPLSEYDEIPVCTGYKYEGRKLDGFPTTDKLYKCEPIIEKLPGWKEEIHNIKEYKDLPSNCRRYIEFIEEKINIPITMVSNGPNREQIIFKR